MGPFELAGRVGVKPTVNGLTVRPLVSLRTYQLIFLFVDLNGGGARDRTGDVSFAN